MVTNVLDEPDVSFLRVYFGYEVGGRKFIWNTVHLLGSVVLQPKRNIRIKRHFWEKENHCYMVLAFRFHATGRNEKFSNIVLVTLLRELHYTFSYLVAVC